MGTASPTRTAATCETRKTFTEVFEARPPGRHRTRVLYATAPENPASPPHSSPGSAAFELRWFLGSSDGACRRDRPVWHKEL
jgi:hypothetical protein